MGGGSKRACRSHGIAKALGWATLSRDLSLWGQQTMEGTAASPIILGDSPPREQFRSPVEFTSPVKVLKEEYM